MPTNIQLSADPISGMVIAAFYFLSTPAGQQLVMNVDSVLHGVVVDLINHVHKQLPDAPKVAA